MRFNKTFHKEKGKLHSTSSSVMKPVYREYFDFLRSLDIEFDNEVFISEILNRKTVAFLERGELYLGIGKIGRKVPLKQIILYVNPIEWSPPRDVDKSLGMIRIDRQEYLKLAEKFKGKIVNVGDITKRNDACNVNWVDSERGSLKEYRGEPSFYMTHYDFYPLSVAAGIINWMW